MGRAWRESAYFRHGLEPRPGAQKQSPLSIGGSSWKLPNGRVLDVIALPYPWIPEALWVKQFIA